MTQYWILNSRINLQLEHRFFPEKLTNIDCFYKCQGEGDGTEQPPDVPQFSLPALRVSLHRISEYDTLKPSHKLSLSHVGI